jgi:hypothetical protein
LHQLSLFLNILVKAILIALDLRYPPHTSLRNVMLYTLV